MNYINQEKDLENGKRLCPKRIIMGLNLHSKFLICFYTNDRYALLFCISDFLFLINKYSCYLFKFC